MMTLSIAYDHRVADGAAAARVTARIRQLLESPASWAEPETSETSTPPPQR
jgi:pyruvate/2-oxoglutarate dehydrogenase complex dihydrolipoamide acyltransferase (E2) component